MSFEPNKTAQRVEAKKRRKAAFEANPEAGEALARVFLAAGLDEIAPQPGPVAGYYPVHSEIDPMPLLRELHARGFSLCLPLIAPKPGPLSFRAWALGEALVPHSFGTMAPMEGGADVIPRLILLPLLAFDKKGGRLGHGQGHFDRTLQALRAKGPVTAIALAFAAQEVDAVPLEPHDEPLDWIVTEREAIQCRDE